MRPWVFGVGCALLLHAATGAAAGQEFWFEYTPSGAVNVDTGEFVVTDTDLITGLVPRGGGWRGPLGRLRGGRVQLILDYRTGELTGSVTTGARNLQACQMRGWFSDDCVALDAGCGALGTMLSYCDSGADPQAFYAGMLAQFAFGRRGGGGFVAQAATDRTRPRVRPHFGTRRGAGSTARDGGGVAGAASPAGAVAAED